jgi:hypothetical protein
MDMVIDNEKHDMSFTDAEAEVLPCKSEPNTLIYLYYHAKYKTHCLINKRDLKNPLANGYEK